MSLSSDSTFEDVDRDLSAVTYLESNAMYLDISEDLPARKQICVGRGVIKVRPEETVTKIKRRMFVKASKQQQETGSDTSSSLCESSALHVLTSAAKKSSPPQEDEEFYLRSSPPTSSSGSLPVLSPQSALSAASPSSEDNLQNPAAGGWGALNNGGQLSISVDTSPTLGPQPIPTLSSTPLHHGDSEDQHDGFLLTIKARVMAFKEKATIPHEESITTTSTTELSKTLTKMDQAFGTYPRKVAVSASHSFSVPKKRNQKQQQKRSSVKKTTAKNKQKKISDSHISLPLTSDLEGGGAREWTPRVDHGLYFAHCCSWLESVIRFSQTKTMKEHLVRLLDIMCTYPNDGIFIRDGFYRTMWANDIFLNAIECERAEMDQPTFTPVDYVHPESIRADHGIFFKAMRGEIFHYERPAKYVGKVSKKVVSLVHRTWFVRDDSSGELCFIISADSFF